ncbi:T9SS type A sorting domain-containing protein [Flavobacterium sp.]|uniref:T9SS type A sorting domain-containing protein n=1 Tax=Flavobacterium sp. TaxID=239 RepID=UPI0026302B94|nr:T9SS type A sorting domain-containing protein [Flavobacterium sp.]
MKKITFNLLFGVALLLSSSGIIAQANDNFANAEAISCGNNYTGSTAAATLDENDAPDGFGADMDAPNVWYSYTGSGAEETITLNLCGSSYDSSVLVYTGSSGSLTLVAGNDDDATCGVFPATTRSRVSFTSDGSTTYYIAIEGYNVTSTGAFTMDVTCSAVNPPAVSNQTCLSALAVDVDASIISSDNSYGDVSPTQTTCDPFGNIQDVWFSFVAPSATVNCTVTKGTMTSANFAIYSGACDALTSLACRIDLTAATTQSLTTLVPGDTYYVQVWSNGAEQGDFTLSLSDPSLCLPAATFASVANCIDNNFTINVDITSLASASSVTVTDNQSSPSQSSNSAGIVTFGPYAFGASVVLTVTNDQSPGCALVSPTILLAGCPPVNDECTNAIALTVNPDFSCANITAGTVAGATASATDATACFGTEDDDVWFSFVATGATHTVSLLNVAGSATDLFHSLWTGADCSSLALVPNSCSDPNTSTISGLTAGETYYLRVNTYTATAGQTTTFNVCIGTPPPPPANDECDAAIALTVNPDDSCAAVTSGTIASATASATDATSCFGTEDDDVWFSFVATDTVQTISLSNVTGSTTDLFHSLWEGDCSGLTLVPNTCSDPNSSSPSGLNIGQTYYLRVYSYTATAGQTTSFDVCIGTPPAPPANDDCASAEALTLNTPVTGSTASASTTTLGITPSCQTNRKNDVWYSIEVPASGTLTVTTNPAQVTAMTDSVVSVFTGSCGSFTEVGCDDDNTSDNFSTVEMTGLTPGDIVLIGVWTYGTTADGRFIVNAFDPTLATNTFDNTTFAYYPSPVKDVLTLSYNKNITAVAVYNLLGQEVITKSANANLSQIDMSNLAKGTYLVKVTADNQIKTIKVIKE